MSIDCPLCSPGTCKGYEKLWENLRLPDGERWRKIHDDLNGAATGSPLIPLDESLGYLRQINECPHRSRDAGCGCSGMKCGLGKGKAGIVSFRECVACVKGEL